MKIEEKSGGWMPRVPQGNKPSDTPIIDETTKSMVINNAMAYAAEVGITQSVNAIMEACEKKGVIFTSENINRSLVIVNEIRKTYSMTRPNSVDECYARFDVLMDICAQQSIAPTMELLGLILSTSKRSIFRTLRDAKASGELQEFYAYAMTTIEAVMVDMGINGKMNATVFNKYMSNNFGWKDNPDISITLLPSNQSTIEMREDIERKLSAWEDYDAKVH